MDQFVRRVLFVAFVAASSLALWKIADALLLGVAGILIAVFLHGAVGTVQHHLISSRRWAWVAVLGSLAVFLGGLAAFLGSEISNQLAELPRLLPSSYEEVLRTMERYKWSAPVAAALPESTDDLSSQLDLGEIGGVAKSLMNAGVTALVVLSIGVFFAASPKTYRRGFVGLFPPSKRSRIDEVVSATGAGLWHWLLGRLVSITAMFVILAIGLSALGVPLALAIAVLGGVFDFIPFFGPIVAGGIAVLSALTVSPTIAAYTAVLYLAAQQLEGNVLTPLIQQQAVEVPPALLLLNLIAFGTLFGVLGALLATPILVMAIIWTKMLYLSDTLGDDVDVPEATLLEDASAG